MPDNINHLFTVSYDCGELFRGPLPRAFFIYWENVFTVKLFSDKSLVSSVPRATT